MHSRDTRTVPHPHAQGMRIPLLLALVVALTAGDPTLAISSGFTGVGEICVLAKGETGQMRSDVALTPGTWMVRGEYRTTGMDALGMIAIDVQAVGRKASLSPYLSTPASGSWSTFALPIRIEQAEAIDLRVGNWRGASDGARFEVRNLTLASYPFEAANWLVNGDFDAGDAGGLPAMWEWKGSKPPDAGSIAVVENTSYRSGRHVLRLTGGNESRVLAYPSLPMPPRGEIEFSGWARSVGVAKRPINLWLFGEGWKPRITCGGEADAAWHRFSGILAADMAKASFGLRIDLPPGEGTVELADLQLHWFPDGRQDATGRSELLRNWQGVPGRNLLLNPDFELDGVGWSYDSSWAKHLADFRNIAAMRPVEIVAGGIDGGHCAAFGAPASARTDMFPANEGTTYAVSLYARATPGGGGDCTVAVYDTEWGQMLAARVDGAPADAWKRYSWTFTWNKPNRLGKAYLRLASRQGVLIDRVQVEEGKATAWEAPVMLGLLRDGPAYVVRGRDRTGFALRVVGDGRGPVDVTAVARDAWGAESWHLARRVDIGGDIPVEVPTDRLGHFHVELTAKRGDAVVGIGAARYAIIDPPRLEEVPAGRFGLLGVCHEAFNYPLWWNQAAAGVLRDLGVRTVRFFARTPSDLPDPLPDDVAASFKADCKALQDAGMSVLPCVDLFAPAEAAGSSLAMPTPEQVSGQRQAMERWVRALQPEVRAVEICNEPDLWRVPSGPDAGKRTMYPAKYVAFQQAACEGIRAVDPGITVVACALNTARFDWLTEWAGAGAGRWMDQFSWHGYGSAGAAIPGEAARMRDILAKTGFTGPVIDSEMYYAWRDFSQRTGTGEYFRGYFHDRELDAAGHSIQFWIGHAAAGVPYCAFAPFITIDAPGPGSQLRTWDLFAALNAASRFLVGAGRGEVLDTGLPYTAILFPQAQEGPLLAVWAGSGVEGSLLLPGAFRPYDIMGNPYSDAQRATGVRLAADPAYVRFPAGTTPEAVRAALASATALGLGPPFTLSVGLGGPDRVDAVLTSRSNKPLDGRLRILDIPPGWKTGAAGIPFAGLAPGGRLTVPIPFTAMQAQDLGSYPLAVIAESGADFARAQTVIHPLFVRHLAQVVADGDVAEWPADAWIPLGEDRLSKSFTEGLIHGGPADLAARIACAWTSDGLAVAAVVHDDIHHPADSQNLGWQGDALQLYVDELGDGERGNPHSEDDVAYTCARIGGHAVAWLDKGCEGNFKGEANKRDGLADPDPRLAIVRHGQDTVYEILLPWASCLPKVRPGAGGHCGISLLIDDNDGAGRKPGLTLAPPGSEPYGAPWDWLDAVLMP